MDMRILVAYQFIFATIFLAPIAFFLERNSRPKLTWMAKAIPWWFWVPTEPLEKYKKTICSSGLQVQRLGTAMINLVPATTYIMALILRQERLGIQTLVGKAKLVGTAIGIGGAMVLTFYKGEEINILSTKVDLTHGHGSTTTHAESYNRLLGLLLSLGCCLCCALYLIIQARMSEKYPCDLSSTVLICVSVAAKEDVVVKLS
ncbi:WAT1-related protein At1g09380-like [Macadamia integrifolia]|uniref:WAT1-related protein At1g09380-like n=1 Tax=Macadamia integrifolia TaxID=60698 RepID=UPI001C4E62F1|nr:WAT1-related protein At1g09380-like [Macadamia integrifolia]